MKSSLLFRFSLCFFFKSETFSEFFCLSLTCASLLQLKFKLKRERILKCFVFLCIVLEKELLFYHYESQKIPFVVFVRYKRSLFSYFCFCSISVLLFFCNNCNVQIITNKAIGCHIVGTRKPGSMIMKKSLECNPIKRNLVLKMVQFVSISLRPYSHQTFLNTILRYCDKKIFWFHSSDFYWTTKVSS